MSDLRPPAVVHFVSDGKPWVILALEYQGNVRNNTISTYMCYYKKKIAHVDTPGGHMDLHVSSLHSSNLFSTPSHCICTCTCTHSSKYTELS